MEELAELLFLGKSEGRLVERSKTRFRLPVSGPSFSRIIHRKIGPWCELGHQLLEDSTILVQGRAKYMSVRHRFHLACLRLPQKWREGRGYFLRFWPLFSKLENWVKRQTRVKGVLSEKLQEKERMEDRQGMESDDSAF